MRKTTSDLALGIRLAVGGSRIPWGRLTLTALGIGLGVGVLLLAASVPSMVQERQQRQDPLGAVGSYTETYRDSHEPPLLVTSRDTVFHDQHVNGLVLQPQNPHAPLPQGVAHFPNPGEMIVSPALRDLLRAPEGQLLRPRMPDRIIGVIGKQGLTSPGELSYYTGAKNLVAAAPAVKAVYPGKEPTPPAPMDSQMWTLLAFGVTVLLVPLVVFVTSTTRLAETARQRRLAALRLVGADGRQVRRIASGEALVGAVLGVLVGWLLFLGGRQAAAHVSVFDFTVFTSDIHPVWGFAAMVTLGVPAVALVTAQLAMRRTIIEPLGVVRRTTVHTRRLGWRLTPMALGVLGLLFVGAHPGNPNEIEIPFLASIVLLLLGVPLVLPWVVEKFVRFPAGRSLTGQLALRRLRASSATAARSVSAIAVVLTGVIGLQTLMATLVADRQEHIEQSGSSVRPRHQVYVDGTVSGPRAQREDLARELAVLPATRDVEGTTTVLLGEARQDVYRAVIVDCATVRELGVSQRCRNGDVFQNVTPTYGDSGPVRPGERLPVSSRHYASVGPGGRSDPVATWRAPDELEPATMGGRSSLPQRYRHYDLILTPRAAEGIPWWARSVDIGLDLAAGAPPEAIERVRNVAAQYLASSSVDDYATSVSVVMSQTYRNIRYGLLLGTLVAFVLIGCGMVVSAVEQIQERRRPMAVLAAVGVRRRTLAISVLLQNGIPMLAAVVVSVLSGLLLGGLVVSVASLGELALDPLGMLGLLVIAAVAVAVVTGFSMPALRRAMHPDGLHTE